ncbi:MAG: hypothetical protein KJP18_00650 [Gemmatimonadetes bacterium]|nr:hypothetical protein [Gemmatimonadota bacterium]NNK63617.1 hypothetical protein [Gemmatimonadota bacterium]
MEAPDAQPKKGLPWARFLVEGLVIVVSILLAFFVDTSWERAQQRDRERDYLLALEREFAAVESVLQGDLYLRPLVSGAVLKLILQVQGAEPAPEDSLFWWSAALSQQLEFDPPRAVLDDLVSSGETGLISDSLRLALASYRSDLATQARRDEQAWAIWEDRTQPLLEGRLPRADRLIRGTFGTRREVPFGLSRHPADWPGLLADPVFEDVLAERWMRLMLATVELRGIEVQVAAIAERIRTRLEALE